MPDRGHQVPSTAAFAEAQDRKRLLLGSDVTFLWPAVVTFPPGTPVDSEGNPYDPTIVPCASTQASAVVRCGAFFKAVNRGGAANASTPTAGGFGDRTHVFLTVAQASAGIVEGASEFIFHKTRFQIDVSKEDEVVLGYQRVLVYGIAEGKSQLP